MAVSTQLPVTELTHVVNQSVLVPDTEGLELGGIIGLINGLEVDARMVSKESCIALAS